MKNLGNQSWWVSVATLGDVRYSQAPGTIASALTLPIIIALYHFAVLPITYGLIIGVFAVFSYIAIEKSRVFFEKPDPKEIVLDECLGMLISFWSIPLSPFSVVVGFLLFRLFDISKIFGIGLFEKLNGTWGILADDAAAGVLTMIILRMLVPVICG